VIALDTNVLVRLLIEDDAAQTHRAKALIRQCEQDGVACYVSEVVVCEVVWVLTSAYRVAREEVASLLRKLTFARQLTFDSTSRIRRATDAFASGRGDFADYLIREQASTRKCDYVATFDKALLKEPGFRAP